MSCRPSVQPLITPLSGQGDRLAARVRRVEDRAVDELALVVDLDGLGRGATKTDTLVVLDERDGDAVRPPRPRPPPPLTTRASSSTARSSTRTRAAKPISFALLVHDQGLDGGPAAHDGCPSAARRSSPSRTSWPTTASARISAERSRRWRRWCSRWSCSPSSKGGAGSVKRSMVWRGCRPHDDGRHVASRGVDLRCARAQIFNAILAHMSTHKCVHVMPTHGVGCMSATSASTSARRSGACG